MVRPQDSEIVNDRYVHCNGGAVETGHPKVYLEIKEPENQIHCPYCNKLFVYKETIKSK
jgi:uncharacterized Zn-finger protein